MARIEGLAGMGLLVLVLCAGTGVAAQPASEPQGVGATGLRTAVVLPWEQKAGQQQPASAALRDDDSATARPLAYVEAGVLASIISCDGRWCRISVGGFRGYIEQVKLWGAYQGEVIR
jgi:SH3-like domain-containing protein